MHYWIDTDPGLDDALAILLAIREVGNAIVGFSSVQGNGEEPLMAHNLVRVLATLERGGAAPPGWAPAIARGARNPLVGGPPERAEAYHGDACLGGLPWTATPDWTARVGSAPAALAIAEAARRIQDLHLVCIGPLTNVALALHFEPELPKLVAGLTIMGGSLRVGGNHTLSAEFNFLADPEAAQLVLQAGFRDVALVPLDVCDEARLFDEDMRRLDALGTASSQLAHDLLRYFEQRSAPGSGLPFYDPAAWLLTMLPRCAQWEEVYVAVDADRGVARGASLADWRRRSGRASNVRAATRLVDRDALVAHFLALLG